MSEPLVYGHSEVARFAEPNPAELQQMLRDGKVRPSAVRQRLPQLDSQYFELLGVVTAVAGQVDTLLAYISELQSDLKSKLSVREAERDEYRSYAQGWQSALYAAATSIEADCSGSATEIARSIRDRFDKLKAELAAYDACLAQVREEMPEVDRIRSDRASCNPQQKHPGWQYAYDSQGVLLSTIDKLKVGDAANRKRIAELESATDDAININNDLQAEVARLESAPPERTDIVERQKYALKQSGGYRSQVMVDIDTLLQDSARYRNAIAIHMQTIGALKEKCQRLDESNVILRGSHDTLLQTVAEHVGDKVELGKSIQQLKPDNARLTAANAEYARRHMEQVERITQLEFRLRTALELQQTKVHATQPHDKQNELAMHQILAVDHEGNPVYETAPLSKELAELPDTATKSHDERLADLERKVERLMELARNPNMVEYA